MVPADLRLVAGQDVVADESALTGESIGVIKLLEALEAGRLPGWGSGESPVQGTQISQGACEAVVVATGIRTSWVKLPVCFSPRLRPERLCRIGWMCSVVAWP